MLEFIKDNWANILLIIVGSFALATYILQERKKKIDAASLIVLQIDEFQERLREISTFIVDGQLNETAFYESLPLMDTDYWNKYKHYFVRKMDATSYTALNQLYEYVSEIQEQQMLMKAFQKNSFQITQFRNMNPILSGSLHNRGIFFYGYLFSINYKIYHNVSLPPLNMPYPK